MSGPRQGRLLHISGTVKLWESPRQSRGLTGYLLMGTRCSRWPRWKRSGRTLGGQMAKNGTHGEWDSAFRGRNVRPSDLTADLSAGDVRQRPVRRFVGLDRPALGDRWQSRPGNCTRPCRLDRFGGARPASRRVHTVWTGEAGPVGGRPLVSVASAGGVRDVARDFRRPPCQAGARRLRDTESDTGSDTLPGRST